MRKLTLVLAVAGPILGAVGMVAVLGGQSAVAASSPCGTSHDSMDAEETQFLALLQGWRDQKGLSGGVRLEASGALNAAAAWFAEYQVNKGGGGGHTDNFGRSWTQRAVDCGYDSSFALGSGEGVYAVSSSGPLNIGPSQALTGITYPGSGVYIPNISATWPAKCAGVAVKRNSSGTAVAWVALIAQYPVNGSCPASTASGGGNTTPTTTTGTPSTTTTPTRTPTPTSTPTPVVFRVRVPLVTREIP